jgi:hypothetical protein
MASSAFRMQLLGVRCELTGQRQTGNTHRHIEPSVAHCYAFSVAARRGQETDTMHTMVHTIVHTIVSCLTSPDASPCLPRTACIEPWLLVCYHKVAFDAL